MCWRSRLARVAVLALGAAGGSTAAVGASALPVGPASDREAVSVIELSQDAVIADASASRRPTQAARLLATAAPTVSPPGSNCWVSADARGALADTMPRRLRLRARGPPARSV